MLTPVRVVLVALAAVLVASCAVVDDGEVSQAEESEAVGDELNRSTQDVTVVREQCGDILCPVGTECCDPLDGECVRPGMSCPLDGADVEEAADIDVVREQCGDVLCPVGTECCDPLDGECVRPGMLCPLDESAADESSAVSGQEPASDACGGTCGDGQICCERCRTCVANQRTCRIMLCPDL